MKKNRIPILAVGLIAIGVVCLACLLVGVLSIGGGQTNPPVIAEPAWDSPRTRELFMRACGDCHSNETVWPWFSKVPFVSWLVTRDVSGGRRAFNVSEWGQRRNAGGESAEAFQNGQMPPAIYLIQHPEARLSSTERQELIQGLLATFGSGEGGGGE
jgi:hypothetical protein